MRRALLVLGGLIALGLLDPAVTAWAARQPGLHLAQHVALAACGLVMAFGARPGARSPLRALAATGAKPGS